MYGFWILVGTFIGYYGLLDLGLSSAISRHIAGAIGAGDTDESNRVCNTSLLIYTGLGLTVLLSTVVTALLSPLFLDNPEDIHLFPKVFIILGLNVAIDLPARVFLGVLYSTLRFHIVSSIQILSLALRTALIVWVLNSGYSVLALALVTFIAGFPKNILLFYFAKKALPTFQFGKRFFNRKTAKSLFSYSTFILIIRISDRLKFHADAFVITAFIGLSAVTHFRIATLLVDYFSEIIGAVFGVLTPFFSQKDASSETKSIRKALFFSTKLSICMTSFICFGLITWGKPFIQIWVGPDYPESYTCLVILTLGMTFALWQAPSIAYMFGTSQHKLLAILNLIEGIVNLLLSLVLVRFYGLVGVALGTFIPMMIHKLFILPVYFCNASQFEYKEYVWEIAKMVVTVCCSLVLPLLISLYFLAPDYNILFTLGFVSLAIYSITVWILGFHPEERQILIKIFVKRLPPKKKRTN